MAEWSNLRKLNPQNDFWVDLKKFNPTKISVYNGMKSRLVYCMIHNWIIFLFLLVHVIYGILKAYRVLAGLKL